MPVAMPNQTHFYEQYPTMRPYVGTHYRKRRTPSLLLIGESHYIPKGSSLNTAPNVWYSGSSHNLSEDDLYYISTTRIIEDSRSSNFSNKAHSIWRNSFSVINQFGPAYADFTRVADDVAFYNFFLRPASTGNSLIVTPQDVEFANIAFNTHFEELKPTAVLFLSTLARNHFRPPQSFSVPIATVPHPGCRWWNSVAKRYGNKRGRDILAEFIVTTNWPKDSPASNSSH
jgi:hypothetical protein